MSDCLQFTYSGDPASSPRDAVRFLVGDTNSKRPLLDDREVNHAIAEMVNLSLAAAFLADHLCARFTREADIKVGQVSKSLSQVAKAFRQKALDLRDDACKTAAPSFPATHHSTLDALEQNNDLVDPAFSIGQFDNPFAVQLDDLLSRSELNGAC